MSFAAQWTQPNIYGQRPRPLKEQRGVYQLRRPKSLAEVNRWRHTPYTERVCWGCRKTLYYHWYLPFLDSIKCSRLYCYRDGTAYHYKEKYKV